MKTTSEVRVWIDEDPHISSFEISTGTVAVMIGDPSNRALIMHFGPGDHQVRNMRALRDVLDGHLAHLDPKPERATLELVKE